MNDTPEVEKQLISTCFKYRVRNKVGLPKLVLFKTMSIVDTGTRLDPFDFAYLWMDLMQEIRPVMKQPIYMVTEIQLISQVEYFQVHTFFGAVENLAVDVKLMTTFVNHRCKQVIENFAGL